jgi:hypothetical protein
MQLQLVVTYKAQRADSATAQARAERRPGFCAITTASAESAIQSALPPLPITPRSASEIDNPFPFANLSLPVRKLTARKRVELPHRKSDTDVLRTRPSIFEN